MSATDDASPRDNKQRTFAFAVQTVRLCQRLDERPGTARMLARQLLRSGTSIGANLEEAQAAESRADFTHKVSVSLKEARETAYWLRILAAAGIEPAAESPNLLSEAEELKRILAAIIVSAKKANRTD